MSNKQNFTLNPNGYLEFNSNLVINNRYKIESEIKLDKQAGTTAKGRYSTVFRAKDLKDGQIKCIKINRNEPEDQKKQESKEESKKDSNNPNQKKKRKSLQQMSNSERELGTLKRITRKNKDGIIPCLIMQDYGEYLGHTYMIFPLYDLPLQQHYTNIQKYQKQIIETMNIYNNTFDALIHPNDLWSFEQQLISALNYIHITCNVMHLDFKPKNIMINTYGYDIIQYAKDLHLIKLKYSKITLIDFNVSVKAPKKANLTDVKYVGNFGTRRYRPPEMIYGGKWNRLVDIYGVAMIILESIKLYPIIDTVYYKKKKTLKYQKNFKELDISQVLYLIIQQIGFPTKEYWNSMDDKKKKLFPQYPLIENIIRKGNKSQLFDNDGYDNDIINKKMEEMKIDSKSDNKMIKLDWNLLSDELKNYKGSVWNLFELYGSNLVNEFKLNVMEESLKKMVIWDPVKRITPEQVLKQISFVDPTNLSNKKITSIKK